jgi:hypothetical protein
MHQPRRGNRVNHIELMFDLGDTHVKAGSA